MTEFYQLDYSFIVTVLFFSCTQAFSQHFSNRNGRALTLSFIHPAVVSAPAPKTSSSNLPLSQSALRPFMKTESVCNDPFTVAVHCQQKRRPSSVIVGICVKKPLTAGRSPPLSPQGHTEVTGTIWRTIYIDQLAPVLFMVFIC